jgi:hypothetical protein
VAAYRKRWQVKTGAVPGCQLWRLWKPLHVNAICGSNPLGAHGQLWLYVQRAFAQPLDAVRVLIVSQDPYPTPGHAVGLSFSVAADVRPIPRSRQNIFQELEVAGRSRADSRSSRWRCRF